jgi:hypothetical protein
VVIFHDYNVAFDCYVEGMYCIYNIELSNYLKFDGTWMLCENFTIAVALTVTF